MAKITYYLYYPTHSVERKRIVNGETVYEYYKFGKGWQTDYSNAIPDSLRGYGDYSVMDVDEIPEEMAMRIIKRQDELKTNHIPELKNS